MVWFYVDDGLAFHTKVVAVGNDAMGLWVRAGAWSAASLTDGYVPATIARSLGRKRAADRLVSGGLWVEVWEENGQKLGGYRFHDWDHRQPTKADVEQKRKLDRARKREQRRGRNVPPGHLADVQVESERNPHGVTVDVREDSSRALPQGCVPLPSPPLDGGWAGNATHHAADTGPPTCQKHPDGYKHDEPCRDCQAIREYDQAATQRRKQQLTEFWADVESCKACSPKGWIETDNGSDRCPNHDWAVLT